MAVAIAITDDTLTGALQRIVAAGQNPEPVLEEIGAYGVKSTRYRFFDETAPGGLPWLPSIRKQRQGGRTLTESGRLRDSLAYAVGAGYVEWGTNIAYAGVHQAGATIRAKTAKGLRFEIPGVGWITRQQVMIPERPFVGVDENDKHEIGGILVHWLEQAAAGGAS